MWKIGRDWPIGKNLNGFYRTYHSQSFKGSLHGNSPILYMQHSLLSILIGCSKSCQPIRISRTSVDYISVFYKFYRFDLAKDSALWQFELYMTVLHHWCSNVALLFGASLNLIWHCGSNCVSSLVFERSLVILWIVTAFVHHMWTTRVE